MSRPDEEETADPLAAVPDWDDEYLDRVSGNLMYNYDLERDHRVRGERFDLYGELRMTNQKQFFHQALRYAQHDSEEHLFVRRGRPTVETFEQLVELGHDLADAWVEADEEHFSTDFTFVLVGPMDAGVADHVGGFKDRTLLKYGFFGHYEVNLVAVDPEAERLAASVNADVATAFKLWDPVEEQRSVLDRLRDLFSASRR